MSKIAKYLGAKAEEYAKFASGSRFFDVPVAELDRGDLLILIGSCAHDQQVLEKQLHDCRANALKGFNIRR